MNLHSKTALVLLLLMTQSLITVVAQTRIQGLVTDVNGKPFHSANVILIQARDSQMVKGTITTSSGTFQFDNVKPGNYRITANFIGYKQFYTDLLNISGPDATTIAPIKLEELGVALNEVVISAKKPLYELKSDRMVINVQSSIVAVGGTALDVLERSPGVIVNKQNNTISMNGKDGVVVMINGKLTNMPLSTVVQLLEGMNAGNIEKIELITTPPAKYDAEGNAGYINIVMVNNPAQGTNGSYSLSMGYGKGETSLASLNFNHRKAKVNFYGDYSFNRTSQLQSFNSYRQVRNNGVSVENSSVSERDPVVNMHNGRLGVDYEASKKTVLGGLFTLNDRKWTMDAVNDVRILNNSQLDTSLNIVNDELNRWRNYSMNLNAQHTFKDTAVISVNLDYLHYDQNNPSNYLNSYYTGSGGFLFDNETKSGKKTPISMWVSNADYSKKIGGKVDLELGVKAGIYRFTNDVRVERFLSDSWIGDPTLTAKYNLREQIAAAYASLNLPVTSKMNMKFGMRYEHTSSNLGSVEKQNIVDRKYGKLFPTFYISQKISDKQSLNLSYSKRITRPTFNDMAPFVIFIDPNTFFSGNAALQPSISNSISSSYNYKSYIFSIGYSQDKLAIAQFQSRIDSTINREILTSENLKNVKSVSATLALPVELTNWWNIQNTVIARWQQVNATFNNQPVRIEKQNLQAVSTHNFKLPKDFSVELTGFYLTSDLFGKAILKPFGTVNLGVQKKINGEKNVFSFNISDLLNTGEFKVYSILPEQNINTSFKGRFDQRTFKISYSRQFGNTKLTGARDRKTGSEEERRRVTQ